MNSSSLRQSVQEMLHNFVSSKESEGDHVAIDILRMIQEESRLLYETQCIQDLLEQDPFHCYDANLKTPIVRFQNRLEVLSCFRVDKDDDYCLQEATVKYHSSSDHSAKSSPRHKKQKNGESVTLLHFRYERTPANETTSTEIWYSIDLSKNYGPKENVLTIRVWADGNRPSRLPAICIEEDDDDDDEEEEDNTNDDDRARDEENNHRNDSKSTKKKGKETTTRQNGKQSSKLGQGEEKKEEEVPDRYACFLDPSALFAFQEATQLKTLDEAQAFFTLMTFPYYQHEWDLVGFVLETIFDNSDEAPDEDP